MSRNDNEGHSPAAGLLKCNPSNICAVFYQISTDSASRGPSATAGLLVTDYVHRSCRKSIIATAEGVVKFCVAVGYIKF